MLFDLKNVKLYCFENSIWNKHKEYSYILGIETKNIIQEKYIVLEADHKMMA